MLFAVKRLAAVEVRPSESNQHEFNASRLRAALGIKKTRVSAKLRLLFYGSDDSEPTVDESKYTLYNSREGKPRAPEYRLYYYSQLVSDYARAGDLFVVFRPKAATNDLIAVVARAGTDVEKELNRLLKVDAATALKRFETREAAQVTADVAERLAQLPLTFPEQRAVTPAHPLIDAAIEAGKMPATIDLATAAQQAVVSEYGDLDCDAFLERVLDQETRLYMAIEKEINERKLKKLIDTGTADLSNVIRFTMSIQQSRKSRRGHSLQHHFEALLRREGIPYEAQCLTEGRRTPDFVIPGGRQYMDMEYPPERLRMVACKSTVRERWQQILKEALRIREKYLLTVDERIAMNTLEDMHRDRLRPFMPRGIRDRAYEPARRATIGSVRDLVGKLREVV